MLYKYSAYSTPPSVGHMRCSNSQYTPELAPWERNEEGFGYWVQEQLIRQIRIVVYAKNKGTATID